MSINVITADSVIISIDKSLIHYFITLSEMIDDIMIDDSTSIPLPNIRSNELNIMIEWATYHHTNNTIMPTSPVQPDCMRQRVCDHLVGEHNAWNVAFAKRFTYQEKLCILEASSYLDFKPFYEFMCQSMYMFHFAQVTRTLFNDEGNTRTLKDMDEELRQCVAEIEPSLKCDLTEEQKEQLLKENTWLYNHPLKELKGLDDIIYHNELLK